MAETIFTCEQVEKLSLYKSFPRPATVDAVVSWLPENFFMSDGPCDTSDWDSENKKPDDLYFKIHKR
jgi:hypothetical protein